jgi:hypothetical protein
MTKTMSLKVYLATENMTLKEFSKLIGSAPRYMSVIMNGHSLPGKRLAKDIKEFTKGQVVLSTKEKPIKVKEKIDNDEKNV